MNPTHSTHRIFRRLPALWLALAAFGLMQLAAQAQITLPAGLKIMPLGDSITLGDGSAAGSGYRYPLYARLNPLAPSFQFVGASSVSPGALPASPLDQRFHNGRESYSCNDINNNLDGLDSGTFNLYGGAGRDPNGGYWLTGGNGTGRAAVYPDAILLLAAANDISRVGMTGVQARIEALLTKITTLRPAARVFLAKSNPYVGYETEVSTFNGLIVTVAANFQAAGKKITVVDLNTNFPADGLSDAVHPNQTGYNWMADRWYDALVGIYGSPTKPVGWAAIPLSTATGIFLANTVAGGNGSLANTSWASPNSYALTGGSSWNVLTDGVTSTKWDACGTDGWGAYPGTSGKGAGFYFTLPVAANMQSIRFFTEDTSPNRSPKTMTIEGSNSGDPMSGASWTLVYAGTAGLDTTPNYSAGNTVDFTNATAYTRYRVLFPTTVDGNPGGVQLADIVATTGASATSNYATWAAAQAPPVTGGPAFVGRDGISNLLIYALDLKLDGTNGSPGTLTGNHLSFTKREAAVTNNDVTYSIEISADLGVFDAWHPAPGVVENTSIPHTISCDMTTVPGGELFARLVVTNMTGPP